MPVDYILNTGAEMLGKKWKASVVWHLAKGPLRFSEIKIRIPRVSVKVLTEVLREMEKDFLIVRKQYPTIPVKVTYEIHPDAESIVKANYVCTIRIGEYIVANKTRLKVPEDMLLDIERILKDNPVSS